MVNKPSPLIKIQHLGTQFGEQVVHKDLNLEVYQGEVLGIVGGSGSGKSVLMRFIIGLDKPYTGTITYLTTPPYPSTQLGVLFQHGALISSLTVSENIMIPMLEVAKLPKKIAKDLSSFKLEMVGLPASTGDKYPSQLSGGMIKRVALARALALDPQILFLDEPTSGLDPISAATFDKLIRQLQKELGMTVVMITHDLDSLVQICDRIGVLIDQHIIAGSLDVIEKIDHPWIKEYFHGSRGQRYFT